MIQIIKALFLHIQELSCRVRTFGKNVKNRKPSHINVKTVCIYLILFLKHKVKNISISEIWFL